MEKTTDTPPGKPMRLSNRTGGAADKKYPEHGNKYKL